MKKLLILSLVVLMGITINAQNNALKPNLKTETAIDAKKIAFEPSKPYHPGQNHQVATLQKTIKNADVVNIVTLGSSANAYSYGYGGGQKSLLFVNNEINTVTNFHRMGGTLDPGGYSGDLGYDISIDGGITWTNMNECYRAVNNAGGAYYTDAARYPNHGIYNPPGNTNPQNAYITYFAPTLDGSNGASSWGGYGFGRAKIGAPTDTIRHLKTSRPNEGIFQYIPDAYCVTNTGEIWSADLNQDWTSGALIYKNSIILNHGVWDATAMDFVYQEFLIDCPTLDGSRPNNLKIEFAPDGITGYIVTLGDNGEVPISTGLSYYPLIYKTNDGGQTWSDQKAVAIAGPDGIIEVQNFLSDTELAELFEAPVPERDEIPFTTAFDFDLSVDAWGNPHIAVIVGITGSNAYSIITADLNGTNFLPCAAMDITSLNGGETWIAHNCGRTYTFRGTFGDLTEDNRICISRTMEGTKMFVSWIDTELPGYSENNNPDIWCRGIDIAMNTMTVAEGAGRATNVTENSGAMWQAYFGTAAQSIFSNNGVYTVPFTYEQMNPNDPSQPVLYKYISDFKFTEADFIIPGNIYANFSADITSVCEGGQVQFTDNSTGGATFWSWEFPGGTPQTSYSQNPLVTYNTPGTHNVTLEISNGTATNSITKSAYITVAAIPEQAGPISGDNMVGVGEIKTYTVSSLAQCTFYDWILTPEDAGLMFVNMNTTTVNWSDSWTGFATLKVRGGNNCGIGPFSPEFEVLVTLAANADFSANITSVCEDGQVQFTDNSTGGATSWSWEFPGGVPQISNEQNPLITYPTSGIYNVTLEVSNAATTSSLTKSDFITVTAIPEQAGQITGDSIVGVGETESYTTAPLAEATLYEWVLTPEAAGSMVVEMNIATITWSDTWTGFAHIEVRGGNACGFGPYSPEFEVKVSNYTGINQTNETGLEIYPNPTSGGFTLNLNTNDIINLSVINESGKIVYSLHQIAINGLCSINIEIPEIGNGIFHLKIEGNKVNSVKKIVVAK